MKARGSGENRVRSNDGLEFFGLKELYAYSLVNGKNAVQIPEAEGKELEDDDDDDELKMMTHAFTKCRDKCSFAPSTPSGKFLRSDWPCELCVGGEGGG